MSKIADSIRRGLGQAVSYAEGTADENTYRVHVPAKIDVKAIRVQRQYAASLGTGIASA